MSGVSLGLVMKSSFETFLGESYHHLQAETEITNPYGQCDCYKWRAHVSNMARAPALAIRAIGDLRRSGQREINRWTNTDLFTSLVNPLFRLSCSHVYPRRVRQSH